MRKLVATVAAILGLGGSGAAAQTADKPPTADLREMVLRLSPQEIGVTRAEYSRQVWGILMETSIGDGYYTLVTLADGSTSLYFSNGGGIIGAGEHATVRSASKSFLDMADAAVAHAQPVAVTPTPAAGQTRFYFLTFDGLRGYSAAESSLGEEQDPLSGLFHSGQAVITALRQLPQ